MTELDPKPALVLIDLQKGILGMPLVHPAAGIAAPAGELAAAFLGYNVVLVSGAMSDRDPDTHTYALEKIFPRLGQVETIAGVLTFLKA